MSGAYLDHAATTPLRAEARAAMEPMFDEVFGNPSGSHAVARRARRALDDAREQVADAVGAHPAEVVFTSGGTEADNLAITGALLAARRTRPVARAVCSAVEHHAVLEPVLVSGGARVAVDGAGRLDLDALAAALDEAVVDDDAAGGGTAVVSVMAANNEVGTRQPIVEATEMVRRRAPGALVHVDAVAAAPWLDLRPIVELADLVSVSAHKVGGPKGIGALVVRGDAEVVPVLRGGGQEAERRSGTPNVAGAVGFAAALAATVAEREVVAGRVEALAARLRAGLLGAVADLVVTTPAAPEDRLPSILHVCVPGVDREALLFLLDDAGVAASWGASCASGAAEPSHVLFAMGVAPDLAAGGLRLSLGRTTTEAEIDLAVEAVAAAVPRLRGDASARVASPRAAAGRAGVEGAAT